MKTAVAYVVVVVIAQLTFAIGPIAGWLFGFVLRWLPDKIRTSLSGLLGGAAGSVLSVCLAYLIFRWLVGSGSFGLAPFLAATVPLSIPIYKNYQMARQLPGVPVALPQTAAMKAVVVGELFGIVTAAAIFLS